MKQVYVRAVFDRKHLATSKRAALVQLEVRYGNERKFMSTGVKVFKGQFKNGRVTGRVDADILNEKIEALYRHIHNIATECIRRNVNFSMSFLEGDEAEYFNMSFIDFIEKRMSEKRYAASSMKNLRMFYGLFVNLFGKIKTFNDITLPNIKIFDSFLKNHIGTKTGRPLTANSIKVYHSILRMFISEAVEFGLVDKHPYSQFRQGRFQTTQRIYLTMEELDMLRHHKASTRYRQEALDLFIVQCYTGMAYSDLAVTDFNDIEEHEGNYILPRRTRIKTGTQYYIMLLPPVLEILRKYEFELPKLGYVNYSKHLKALDKETGLNKNITSHVGRHTFATTIALGSGIPIEVVSKMLGHTNIQTTQIYAKILPKSVFDGFNKIQDHIKKSD